MGTVEEAGRWVRGTESWGPSLSSEGVQGSWTESSRGAADSSRSIRALNFEPKLRKEGDRLSCGKSSVYCQGVRRRSCDWAKPRLLMGWL